jgi:hypothetical protein
MIGQYLSNNNENATVAFCQKFWHPNGALVGLVFFLVETLRYDVMHCFMDRCVVLLVVRCIYYFIS